MDGESWLAISSSLGFSSFSVTGPGVGKLKTESRIALDALSVVASVSESGLGCRTNDDRSTRTGMTTYTSHHVSRQEVTALLAYIVLLLHPLGSPAFTASSSRHGSFSSTATISCDVVGTVF